MLFRERPSSFWKCDDKRQYMKYFCTNRDIFLDNKLKICADYAIICR